MGFAPIPRLSQSRMLTSYTMVPISVSRLKKVRPMPVTLRHRLIDNQACYFYNNGAENWSRRHDSHVLTPGPKPGDSASSSSSRFFLKVGSASRT